MTLTRVLFLAGIGGLVLAAPSAAQCTPDGDIQFVCGPVSPEDLVLHPANDYVARFVKNVPRSKVVRVSSIMRDATSSDSVGDWVVNANDRLSDVAPRIGGSIRSIAIRDDNGATLGYVDRDKFVRVLAGVTEI